MVKNLAVGVFDVNAKTLKRDKRPSNDSEIQPPFVLHDARTIRLYLVGHICLAISTLCVGAYIVLVLSNLKDYMDTFLDILGSDYQGFWNFFVYSPFIAGTLAFVLAGFAFLLTTMREEVRGIRSKSVEEMEQARLEASNCVIYCGSPVKGWFRTMLIFMIALFISQAIFSGGFLFFLNSLERAIERQAGEGEELSELESDISSLQLAAFNLCCSEKGWSSHDAVAECDNADGIAPDSCGLPSETEKFGDILCSCYTSPRYNEFYDALKKSDMCTLLSNAIVKITSDDQIPGTNIPVDAFVQVEAARIVGFNGLPEDDTTTQANPKGYGCGFGGYARAFQWMQFEYLTDTSYGCAVAIIIISVIELGLMVLIFFQLQAGNDGEYFDAVRAQILDGKLDKHMVDDIDKFQESQERKQEKAQERAAAHAAKQEAKLQKQIAHQQTKDFLKHGHRHAPPVPSAESNKGIHDNRVEPAQNEQGSGATTPDDELVPPPSPQV